MIVREIRDRWCVFLEYIGLEPIDEPFERSYTHELRPDVDTPDLIFRRLQVLLIVLAIATGSTMVAAQIRIAVTRQPVHVVDSYYIDHDGSGR